MKAEIAALLVLDQAEPSANSWASIEQTGGWDDLEKIDLTLGEALANAIIHGNLSYPGKSLRICVALYRDCELLIGIKDAGWGFDPSQLPNPVVGQNLHGDNAAHLAFR
jgi:anti-sigma regulatory factor (Ser/Thr protein kinase)